MKKRFWIALLFFTAFSVMMAHNLVPHHHHPDKTNAVDYYDTDHQDTNNDLDNLFSHFQHIGINNQFVSTHQSASVKQIDSLKTAIAFITAYYFFLSGKEEPVHKFFPDPPDICLSSGVYAFSLRGPPSFTV